MTPFASYVFSGHCMQLCHNPAAAAAAAAASVARCSSAAELHLPLRLMPALLISNTERLRIGHCCMLRVGVPRISCAHSQV